MEIKRLKEYTDRQLLELILSNQVRMEQRLCKMYEFMSDKHGEEFHKNNKQKSEVMEDFVNSHYKLNQQINEIISEQKD